jgi:hypothetical protein
MEQNTHEALKNYRDNIEYHLQTALNLATHMQQVVFSTEGDSDLNRYLGMYLVPGMNHWLTGNQAGNMKFLKELFERREKEQVAKAQESAKMGDGHEVLTDPKK